MITGKDMIGWGFTPGPWFKEALLHANLLQENGHPQADIIVALKDFEPDEPVFLERRKHDAVMRRNHRIHVERFLAEVFDERRRNKKS